MEFWTRSFRSITKSSFLQKSWSWKFLMKIDLNSYIYCSFRIESKKLLSCLINSKKKILSDHWRCSMITWKLTLTFIKEKAQTIKLHVKFQNDMKITLFCTGECSLQTWLIDSQNMMGRLILRMLRSINWMNRNESKIMRRASDLNQHSLLNSFSKKLRLSMSI